MKKNIALFAGGNSGEAEISLKSAAMIAGALNPERYNVYTIVLKNRDWSYKDCKNSIHQIDKNDFSLTIDGEKVTFDCAYIAIHGTPGEDGLLQGYLEMMGVPYVSCSLLTSAITFSKSICNTLAASWGVNVAESVVISRNQIINIDEIASVTGFPCFVKPNNGGSSIGASLVHAKEELTQAIKKALTQDKEALIESYLKGTEITCGVIKAGGRMIVLPITEIVPVEREFFDFVAKYQGFSREITPARIDEEIEKKCKATSAFLYEKLNCRGVVRFDYIVVEGELYFLEVNTVPGQTEQSIVPQQARVMGISISDLYEMLINDAFKQN